MQAAGHTAAAASVKQLEACATRQHTLAATATSPVILDPQPSSLVTTSYVPQETVITAMQQSAQG
jgi:hypothetical protein